jgi:hypothetical protein
MQIRVEQQGKDIPLLNKSTFQNNREEQQDENQIFVYLRKFTPPYGQGPCNGDDSQNDD